MPTKSWDTKADFDAVYNIGLEPEGHPGTRAELRGHYERRALFNASVPYLDYVTPEWSRIVAHFDWPTNTAICIVGAGFGWSIEYLNARGYADVWGVDPSPYIQGAKDEIDPADGIRRSLVAARIHDAKFPTASEVSRFLRDAEHRDGPDGETPFDVCVTERVLSSLANAEAVEFSDGLRALGVVKRGGEIAHIETPTVEGRQDSTMEWRALAELKTLLPDDIIVRSGGGEFL